MKEASVVMHSIILRLSRERVRMIGQHCSGCKSRRNIITVVTPMLGCCFENNCFIIRGGRNISHSKNKAVINNTIHNDISTNKMLTSKMDKSTNQPMTILERFMYFSKGIQHLYNDWLLYHNIVHAGWYTPRNAWKTTTLSNGANKEQLMQKDNSSLYNSGKQNDEETTIKYRNSRTSTNATITHTQPLAKKNKIIAVSSHYYHDKDVLLNHTNHQQSRERFAFIPNNSMLKYVRAILYNTYNNRYDNNNDSMICYPFLIIPRRQYQFLLKYRYDLMKVLPTVLLCMVPVAGNVLILLAALIPKVLLTTHFWNTYEIYNHQIQILTNQSSFKVQWLSQFQRKTNTSNHVNIQSEWDRLIVHTTTAVTKMKDTDTTVKTDTNDVELIVQNLGSLWDKHRSLQEQNSPLRLETYSPEFLFQLSNSFIGWNSHSLNGSSILQPFVRYYIRTYSKTIYEDDCALLLALLLQEQQKKQSSLVEKLNETYSRINKAIVTSLTDLEVMEACSKRSLSLPAAFLHLNDMMIARGTVSVVEVIQTMIVPKLRIELAKYLYIVMSLHIHNNNDCLQQLQQQQQQYAQQIGLLSLHVPILLFATNYAKSNTFKDFVH